MSPWLHVEALLYFVAFMLATSAWHAVRSPRTRVMLRRVTRRTVVQAAGVALAVIVLAAWLRDAVPALGWSWWRLLGLSQGSVVTGQVTAPLDYQPGVILQIAPVLFPLLLLFAMPRLVWIEERWFRRGAERFGAAARIGWPLGFGAAHLVVGVPVFAAVGLTLTGAIFQRAYLRGYAQSNGSRLVAVQTSAALHLSYNLVVLAIVALAFAVHAVAGNAS